MQAGDAVKLALQRNGDLLLDLFGGMAWILGNNLGGHVSDVGIRLDGELLQGVETENGKAGEHRQHQPAPAQTETNEARNHWNNTPSFARTDTPASNPLLMTVRSPCCDPTVTSRGCKVQGLTCSKTNAD